MKKMMIALGLAALAMNPALAAQHQHGQKYECEHMEDGKMKCCKPGEDGKVQCHTMKCMMMEGEHMSHEKGGGHMMGEGHMMGKGHSKGEGQSAGEGQAEHQHQ